MGAPSERDSPLFELMAVIAILGVDRTIVAGHPGRPCGGAMNPVRYE